MEEFLWEVMKASVELKEKDSFLSAMNMLNPIYPVRVFRYEWNGRLIEEMPAPKIYCGGCKYVGDVIECEFYSELYDEIISGKNSFQMVISAGFSYINLYSIKDV